MSLIGAAALEQRSLLEILAKSSVTVTFLLIKYSTTVSLYLSGIRLIFTSDLTVRLLYWPERINSPKIINEMIHELC